MTQQQHTTHAPALPIVIITSLEERRAKCAWCWEKRNPGVTYPREWSSTICPECETAVDAEFVQLKAARAARRQRGVHAFHN